MKGLETLTRHKEKEVRMCVGLCKVPALRNNKDIFKIIEILNIKCVYSLICGFES